MANIVVSTTDLGVNVAQTVSVITITDTESNVIVANLATAVANVAVTTTELSINVDQTAIVSNSAVRTKIFVSNLSGFGNLAYDSGANSNGIIQYTGTSNADILSVVDDNPANITQHLSVVDTGGDGSLSYANTTGVFTYTGPSAAEVRAHISLIDNGGDGSMGYNPATGIIEYTGPSASEVRAHISATSPITYNASTGAIGLEQTLDDLTLVKYQETIVDNGSVSGTATFNITAGTVHTANVTADITNIVLANISAGGSATLFLKQDTLGGLKLLTQSFTGVWKFLNDNTAIDQTPNATSVISVFYDGTTYTAAITDYADSSTTDSVSQGNVLLHRYLRAEEYGPSQLLTTNFLDVDDGSSSAGITANTNGSVYAVKQPAIALPSRVPFVYTVNSSVSHERYDGSFFPGQMNINFGERVLTHAAIWSKDTDTGKANVITNPALMGFPPTVDGINVLNQIQSNMQFDHAPMTSTGLGFMNGTDPDTYNSANVHTAFLTFPKADPNGQDGQYTGSLRITNTGGSTFGGGGILVNSPHINLTTIGANKTIADKANMRVSIGTIDTDASNLLLVDGNIGSRGDVTATGNVNAAIINTTANAYIGANLNVAGNLEVTGNINYREVEDLLVRDQTITLNFGNASAQNAQIIVDRAGSGFANTDLKWNETADRWQFTNDGTTYFNLAESTSDLTEGTNLYYTDGRFDTRLATKSTSDLTEGTNLYYTDARVDAHLTGGTGIDYTAGTIDLADTAVTPGTYGDASNIPQLIVDQQGRITGVSDIAVSIPASYGNVEVADFLANGFGSNTITTTGDITTTGFFEGDLNGAVTIDVYNDTGATLSKGDVVYLTGSETGANPHVALADSDDATKMPAIGVVKEQITDTNVGQVVTSGEMNDSSHGYTLGADLYVDTTAGGLTTTVPTGEDKLIQKIGKVVGSNHILIQGAFRTNATPNLNDGNIFIGNGSNQSVSAVLDTSIVPENTNLYYTDARVATKIDSYVVGSENITVTSGEIATTPALGNINSITTEASSGFTLDSNDGIVFKQKFNTVATPVSSIAGDGYALFGGNDYASTARVTYTGTTDLTYYEYEGTITSGSPDITVNNMRKGTATFTVGSLVTGTSYIIVATGTTDFTAIGSADNNPGTVFTATGAGTGTGTVRENILATVADLNVGYNQSGTTSVFPNEAYVLSVNTGTNTITMSTDAIASGSIIYGSGGGDQTFDPAVIDTTTGLVISLISDLKSNGGSYTSIASQQNRKPGQYGYPQRGPVASDFNIYAIGSSADYTFADASNFTVARTSFTAANTIIKANEGIVIGQSTDLTNRGENDVFKSFGINMLWDGLTTTPSSERIQPAVLLKSYSDNSQGQTNRSSGAPRLFFTTANGNINDNPYGAHPLANQELGRTSYWGSTGTQLSPSSYNVPAYTSVHAADNWNQWNGGVAGNTNVYNAATSNGVNADTYLAYKEGELFLGSNSTKPITLAPASQTSGFTPHNAYLGLFTTWANVHYANPGASTGAKVSVTNGGSVGAGTVGDMELGVKRVDNSSTINYTIDRVTSAAYIGQPSNDIMFRYSTANSPPTADFTTTPVNIVNGTEGGLAVLNGVQRYLRIYNSGYLGFNWFNVYDDASYTTKTTYSGLGLSLTPPYYAAQTTAYTPIVTSSGVTAKEWKFKLEEQSDTLKLQSGSTTKVEFTDDASIFSNRVRFQNLTTAEISALASPQSGDTVYNTTIDQLCFYDGTATAWQKIDSQTM